MTVSTSPSKHTVHSLFLLPAGSGAQNVGETGGLSGELGAVTRDDSEAEDDWLTLKAMSESLSSWEPLRDPEGVVVAGLDCRVPSRRSCPAAPPRTAKKAQSAWLVSTQSRRPRGGQRVREGAL